MQLQSNTLLQGGKYRIEKVLGQGGFGITYLATQVALGRKVAIKEFFMKEYCERNESTSHVSLGTSGSRETVERFRTKFIKEAQTIAGLNHPHIIRIHDIFEENGTAYYVMEYWDNGSLADYVKDRGKLSEAEALHYIRQVADALGYIHERKMNHLDVKPGNILLDANKNAVLIDFGLSKRYDAEGNQTSTTPVGISHGYAPLEQYKKGGVGTFSPATDIYSLGATLYKLLTGQTPPEANDVMDDGLPALPASVSPATAAAIEKAMQPRKVDRPASIGAFMEALNGSSFATSSPQSEPKSKPRPTVDEETEIWTPSYVETEEKKERKEEVTETPRPSATLVAGEGEGKAKGKLSIIVLSVLGTLIFLIVLIGNGNCGGREDVEDIETVTPQKPSKPAKEPQPVPVMDSVAVVEAVEPAAPAPSLLYVTTSPSGATVYVDGKKVGTSPIEGKEVSRGRHTIKISKSGYESISETEQFEDKPVVLNHTLSVDQAVLEEQRRAQALAEQKAKEEEERKAQALAEQKAKEEEERRAQVLAEQKVKEEAELKAKSSSPTGTINGHGYVDLGLSVKWAYCNVGASSPSDYGSYFAWGETSTKSEYTKQNSATYDKKRKDLNGNSRYDAARANWGGSWRLPTLAELEELESKCKRVWTTQGGHNGYKVTGPNGNSIFLPAAGWRVGSSLSDAGEDGYYWCSTPDESDARNAYHLCFDSSSHYVWWCGRYVGHSVRPVSE